MCLYRWNATYEGLLGTNRRFSQPIPLSVSLLCCKVVLNQSPSNPPPWLTVSIFDWQEMIDFLVDVWEQEGMYDWQREFQEMFWFLHISGTPVFINCNFIKSFDISLKREKGWKKSRDSLSVIISNVNIHPIFFSLAYSCLLNIAYWTQWYQPLNMHLVLGK